MGRDKKDRQARGDTIVDTVKGGNAICRVVRGQGNPAPFMTLRTASQDGALFSQILIHHYEYSPMYMYCLNRLRSFSFDPSPNRRASLTHEVIVRSSIPYGANFDDVLFPSRIDFGSCFSGIGY